MYLKGLFNISKPTEFDILSTAIEIKKIHSLCIDLPAHRTLENQPT